MNELRYQKKLMDRIYTLIPECHIFKNDPEQLQGVPDLLILFEDQWAMLEVKASSKAPVQPNQVYHVNTFHEMSFASFINPETEEEVLDDLQRAFGIIRKARVSQS